MDFNTFAIISVRARVQSSIYRASGHCCARTAGVLAESVSVQVVRVREVAIGSKVSFASRDAVKRGAFVLGVGGGNIRVAKRPTHDLPSVSGQSQITRIIRGFERDRIAITIITTSPMGGGTDIVQIAECDLGVEIVTAAIAISVAMETTTLLGNLLKNQDFGRNNI